MLEERKQKKYIFANNYFLYYYALSFVASSLPLILSCIVCSIKLITPFLAFSPPTLCFFTTTSPLFHARAFHVHYFILERMCTSNEQISTCCKGLQFNTCPNHETSLPKYGSECENLRLFSLQAFSLVRSSLTPQRDAATVDTTDPFIMPFTAMEYRSFVKWSMAKLDLPARSLFVHYVFSPIAGR